MRFSYTSWTEMNQNWERLDAALTAKVASLPIVTRPWDVSYTPQIGMFYTPDARMNDSLNILDAAVGLGTVPSHAMGMTGDADTNHNIRVALQVLQNLGITIPVNP